MSIYYQDDLVTLHHGDCLAEMSAMPDNTFDLVFTSPPYNLGVSSGGGFASPGGKSGKWTGGALAQGYASYDDSMPFGEYVEWQKRVLTECWRLIKPTGAIFYQHKSRVQNGLLQTPMAFVPEGIPLRQIIIWDRGSGMNFAPTHYVPAHELILVLAGSKFRLKNKGASGLSDVWRVNPASGNAHPAPFPIALPARAIESTGAQCVLDPFSGSGTTLRAASDAHVRSVGIELSKTYCEMSAQRLQPQTLDIFGGAA